jgi:TPR repeat protein
MNELGICYAEGIGVEKDMPSAIKYFKDAYSRGSVRGMHNYALALQTSDISLQEQSEIPQLLQMAAEGGESDSLTLYHKFLDNYIPPIPEPGLED